MRTGDADVTQPEAKLHYKIRKSSCVEKQVDFVYKTHSLLGICLTVDDKRETSSVKT